MDAASEKELYEILEDLPIWEQVEAETRRMQGFEDLVDLDETEE
jgi:hypothetical protein